MKRIILLTSLCLAGLAGPTFADSQALQIAQSDTTTSEAPAPAPSLAQQRADRIQNNTATRTDNRIQRREDAANAVGAPGLDQGIERRNDRRENRRDVLRTGQPAPSNSPSPQQ